jgi:geranyl-CoA carboxylase alpha subunit
MPRLANILVANRGEIALRVMRTARAMGYGTTAIYSEADAQSPHVAHADRAVCVGPARVSESYLDIARIIAAARSAGADAVHPGYGLLSENAAFARACAEAGLVFIGPRPETIELMGNKRRARVAMAQKGVPCVPGYDGEDQSPPVLEREAARIGFPIMVKAAAGGGGRGMRRVSEPGGLLEALSRARSEAEKAFGDGRLILERALDGARHVEVQVVADSHGHVIHLGERDCSIQRRFQKLIEEAPAPSLDHELRRRIGEIGVLVARSSDYVGVGTVELLVDPAGGFYFLEMNTRIQVEHPVTELITGVDLVAWQLRIAEGDALPLSQAELQVQGHAIEARVYAEDPARGFAPETGRVGLLSLPGGEGVRVDHALCEGLVISPHYDAMLAKLVAHGSDRQQARRRLLAALRQLRVLGVRTNQDFLITVLEHPSFVAAEAAADFVDRQMPGAAEAEPSPDALAAAAWLWSRRQPHPRSDGRPAVPYAPELAGFSNSVGLLAPLVLECAGRLVELGLQPDRAPDTLCVHSAAPGVSKPIEVALVAEQASRATLSIAGAVHTIDYVFERDQLFLHLERPYAFRDVTHRPAADAERGPGSGRGLSPIDGSVVDVAVSVGEHVVRGQTLVVIEAMKLELRVVADANGVVSALHTARGSQVKARQLLVEVAVEDAGG